MMSIHNHQPETHSTRNVPVRQWLSRTRWIAIHHRPSSQNLPGCQSWTAINQRGGTYQYVKGCPRQRTGSSSTIDPLHKNLPVCQSWTAINQRAEHTDTSKAVQGSILDLHQKNTSSTEQMLCIVQIAGIALTCCVR